MKVLVVATLVLSVVSASPASAQFTSAVVPPKAAPKVDTVARRDSVEKANVQLAQRVGDMKRWVDSAALAIAAKAPADTGAAVAAQPRSDSVTVVASGEVTEPPTETQRFHNGATAPSTATPLPLLALIGASALAVGSLLRRRI